MWFPDQLKGNVQSLSLAPADELIQWRSHLQIPCLIKPKVIENVIDGLIDFLLCIAVETELGVEIKILIHGELLYEQIVLGYISDHPFQVIGFLNQVVTVDIDVSAVQFETAVEHLKQG